LPCESKDRCAGIINQEKFNADVDVPLSEFLPKELGVFCVFKKAY
jgi:hypothetical protein